MESDRVVKTAFNREFARLAGALANPHRVELLDLLAQGERSVEALATEAAMSVSLASAHLRALRLSRLVETRRDGPRVLYRLAGDEVYALLGSLRAAARARLPEIHDAAARYLADHDGIEPVTREELVRRVRDGRAVVIDVRPAVEYRAGHIRGAVSVPLQELEDRLGELPDGAEIVAYCRGPYCLYASTAVAELRRRGFAARRLVDGFPEWRLAGLPTATGSQP